MKNKASKSEKSTPPQDRITKSWPMKSTLASLGLFVFVLVIGFLLYTNLEAGFNGPVVKTKEKTLLIIPDVGHLSAESFSPALSNNGAHNILFVSTNGIKNDTLTTGAIMILQFDSSTNQQPHILSIMPNTLVDISGISGREPLGEAFLLGEKNHQGAKKLAETIQANFGISSYYYVLTQNSSISQEIDNVFPDGLQLDFPSPVKVSNGNQTFSFSTGTHQLSGEALAAYMRADAVTTSSSLLTQVNRQQEVLSALIEQLQKQNSVQKNSSKTMETLLSFTSNNLTPDFSSQLLTELLASSNVKVKTLIAPVSADTKLVTSKTSLQNLQITNKKDNRQRIADFLNQ